MKEATGEANITVITIVLIAIVLAVGTVIVNQLLTNTAKKSACSGVGGRLSGNTCTYPTSKGGDNTCTVSKCADSRAYQCKTSSGTVVIACE